MRFHLAGVPGVEFAVDQRVQQHLAVEAVHGDVPPAACNGEASAEFHAARSIERARANRDITVPTGMRAAAAISSYDRSLTSRNTMASRNGCGRSAIKRRIVA